MSRIGWLDCSSGVSGDMLLGALHQIGALAALPDLLADLADLGVAVTPTAVTRQGLAATAVTVFAPDHQPRRDLTDVLAIVARCGLPERARERAEAIFRRLAAVEAAVHGTTVSEVHFHEVGALDSIVDVLGACLGFDELALDVLTVSPIALGGGTVTNDHGPLPVPTPAAIGLLADTPLRALGTSIDAELATPTGIAVLAEWATSSGPMPDMAISGVGVGAGQRDLDDRPNIVRLVIGSDARTADDDASGQGWHTIEANVDDLDPRLWPAILDRVLEAGAVDVWLTPITMKKGRPAHTVSALVDRSATDAVRSVLLRETSTIGVRMTPVDKHALTRSWITVVIDGQSVRVKLAYDGHDLVNISPEFDDVASAAHSLGLPAKTVLARANAAAHQELG
ncbi:MAG TPA: nickel pincer cofactor biosynthesis protein LarC [Mycobacteriales bacterium]|nr:nickel pincer cofactor biosynthesis protein LarC [Mycobacteriales bacterium]